jgi:hypothetical protein
MSTPWFRDPFRDPQGREQAALGERIGNIEARPQAVAPVPLIPRPISVFPSADWYQPVTSATFQSVWEGLPTRWSHLAVWAIVPWRTGAGTAGELRLQRYGGDLDATYDTTDAVALAAASSGEVTFRWLHGSPIWGLGGIVYIDARRTAGANNVEIGHPSVVLIDPAEATQAGV